MGKVVRARERLSGRWILVVEDDYLLAAELAQGLRKEGARVIGPVPSITAALHLIRTAPKMDGALLDVNLQGEMAFPVADALLARGVPFAFVTDYSKHLTAARYTGVSSLEKPVNLDEVTAALGSHCGRSDAGWPRTGPDVADVNSRTPSAARQQANTLRLVALKS